MRRPSVGSARGRRPILHGPFLPWPPRGADSEQGPMTPEDSDQVGTRPRMRGDRARRSQDRQAAGVRCHNFSVRTTLRATPATREELLYEIGNQLADFEPPLQVRLHWSNGDHIAGTSRGYVGRGAPRYVRGHWNRIPAGGNRGQAVTCSRNHYPPTTTAPRQKPSQRQ